MSSANGMFQIAILFVLAVSCAGRESGARRGGGEVQTMESTMGVAGEEERRYVPGQVLVKFRDGTDAGTIARIQREVHLETVRVVSSPNLFLMRLVDQASVEETVRQLQMYNEVVLAEPNYVRRIQ